MSLPSQAKALSQPKRLPRQVFAQTGDEHGMQEDRRRRDVGSVAPVAPAKAGPVAESPASVTPLVQKPPTPQGIIDRLHKESGNIYGGYVFVGPDHDSSEADQMPPSNPGWRSTNVTASSIADAYAKAQIMKAVAIKDKARIAILALGSTWTESALSIDTSGIDFFGMGGAVIFGGLSVTPGADTNFYNLDVYSLDVAGGLTLAAYPLDTDPRTLPSTIKGCRFFGTQTAFHSLRRIYAEHCEFYQTTRVDVVSEIGACLMEIVAPLPAEFSVFKDCRFFAYSDTIVNMGQSFHLPYGFALVVRLQFQGSLPVLIGGANCYVVPNTGVILDTCEVMGSLLAIRSTVEHKGGRQHGGIPHPSHSGNIYARLRGQPIFNSDNGLVGYMPAWVTFDNVQTHSTAIAQFAPYNGTYPVGVTPSDYPGVGYLAFRHSPHMMGLFGAAAAPFVNAGAVAIVDVVNSSTGCPNWNGTTITTLFGSCPVNVTGNREFYIM